MATEGAAPERGGQRAGDALVGANDEPNRRVLLRGATVLSMDPAVGDFERADILIVGSKIEAVGPDLGGAAEDGQTLIVELGGSIVIPGLQDTHRHSWQNQLRRLLPDIDIDGYVTELHLNLGPNFRPEDIYAGNLISGLGAIDSGVTTVMDFSHNSRSAAHSDAAIEAWFDSGVRAIHASCAPLSGAWDEQWPGDVERIRDQWFSSDDQLVTLRLGLIGRAVPEIQEPVALSADGLQAARDLGLEISVDAMFGLNASAQLEELGEKGLLGPDMTYIHCQDISDKAWQWIADTGGSVSLAPTSDAQLGLASGVTPVQKSLDMGIRPALSVDVECCLTTDLFTQMQVVLNIQRMLAFNARFRGDEDAPSPIPLRDVLDFATVQGAKANGLIDKSGTITPGKEADLVVIGADDFNTMPLNNAVGTVVLAADTRNVEAVFIGGQVRKWDARLVGHDIDRVRALVSESRDYVLSKSGFELDVLS
jgi:cytosine/adenosine deaminase-related metal-dependent hydrolase